MSETSYDAIIVGGGLAGLTTGAILAKKGKKVLLLERSLLGGRAVTVDLKGFKINFGAHAIYGRDTSVLNTLEKELNLHIDWKEFDSEKAKYDLGNDLSVVPTNLTNLIKTKVLSTSGKMLFAYEIVKTILNLEKGEKNVAIGEWLERKNATEEIKEMILGLAASNFFTREPENIPSDVFFTYYHRIFKTKKPVSYIAGGWSALVYELKRVIEENGGEIQTKVKAEKITFSENRVNSLITNKGEFFANDFVFCIPPSELTKIFEGTSLEKKVSNYATYDSTAVIVYDIGLKKRVESKNSYIFEKKNKVFVTDISYYDPDCTPEGGQLIQGIAYLKHDEIGNKEILEKYKGYIEDIYDKHFPGWRDEVVVQKVSQKAVVQEIAWNMKQTGMPTYFPEYENSYFAGDWCKGTGQLSELSFSSANEVADKIK